MFFSQKEKIMFNVMNAIYDCDIHMSFKGSMVLKTCLNELGYKKKIRGTVDIDSNWLYPANPPIEHIQRALQEAVDSYGFGFRVDIRRSYGEGKSAGFSFVDVATNSVYFTMDIDVNKPTPQTKIYSIDGIKFCGVLPLQILADKVSVVSSNKVFSRVKDVIDLYYLSSVFEFEPNVIFQTLAESGRVLGDFNGFLNRIDELEHAYDKFRLEGVDEKEPFVVVYSKVKKYIEPILPKINKDKQSFSEIESNIDGRRHIADIIKNAKEKADKINSEQAEQKPKYKGFDR